MSASASSPRAGTASSPWVRRTTAGVLGGLSGGIVFGALMAMMGMFTMIAALAGSTSPWAGVGIHMVISVGYGLVLTLLFTRFLSSYGRGSITGLVYGFILWVIGPLLVMPLMLGMPVFVFNVAVMMSLIGHLLYGLIVALVAVWSLQRAHA